MKELYNRMNEHITPSPAVVNSAVNAATRPAVPKNPRRPLVPVLALLLVLVIATPALAAGSTEFNALLYRIAPEVALYFRPVNLSDTDAGITVSVLAVDVDGPVAEMYIAVTGEGVDGTIDLYDSYHLDRNSDTRAGCYLASWDAESGTAVFRIHYELMDGSDIAATDKVTFSVSRMLRNKQEQTVRVLAGAAMPQGEAVTLQADAGAGTPLLTGWGGHDGWRPDGTVMTVGQSCIPIVDGLTITAAGWMNGDYRVQVHEQDKLATDNHAFLYWMDGAGNVIEEECSVDYIVRDADGVRQDYRESIFHITPEELAGYTLYAYTVTAAPAIEGEWSITFPLTDYTAE